MRSEHERENNPRPQQQAPPHMEKESMCWKMCSGSRQQLQGQTFQFCRSISTSRDTVIQRSFKPCRDGVGRGVEVSIANGYPFARPGAHTPFLSWSNSSLGTNNSAYPQSKQTTIFWIKLTGARFSFSIGEMQLKILLRSFVASRKHNSCKPFLPPIRSTSRRIFSLASLFHRWNISAGF